MEEHDSPITKPAAKFSPTRALLVTGGVGLFIAFAAFVQPFVSSASPGTAPAPESEEVAFETRSMLGELHGRHYRVRIYSSGPGTEPSYDVCDLDGTVLEADLLADQVYRSFPDLEIEDLQFGPDESDDGPIELMLVDPPIDGLP